jgi:pimeloyl-ACP methyl ester carboxylesterase
MRAATVVFIVIAFIATGHLSSLGAQETYPPMGKLVDIGGRRLHVHCTGAGSPTVILESGASSFAIDWALVQPGVARTARVCSYDRSGYGWSDAASYDLRGEDAVVALHSALDVLGERPPFILVGQSMGGRFVRLFAHRYPREAAGMVLVDAEHEDGLFIGVGGKPVAISMLSDAEFDAAFQVPPLPLIVPEARLQLAHQKLPEDLQRVRLWLERRFLASMRTVTRDSIVATMRSEHEALATLHRLSATEEHPLKGVPLVVLTRGLDQNEGRLRMQADLVRLSSNSRQIVVADSDHEIHLFRPDAVIQAIADVSTAVRTHRGL